VGTCHPKEEIKQANFILVLSHQNCAGSTDGEHSIGWAEARETWKHAIIEECVLAAVNHTKNLTVALVKAMCIWGSGQTRM